MTSKESLLSMFGFDATPPSRAAVPAASVFVSVAPGGAADKALPPSPHALVLDQWSRRRGADYLAENAAHLAAYDLGADDEATTACAADFLAAAYESKPRLSAACEDPLRAEFVAQLLDTESYVSLHKSTTFDEVNSEIAANSFAKEFSALRARRESEPPADEFEAMVQAVEAVGEAVRVATKDVEDLAEAEAAFGPGSKMGDRRDPAKVAEMYQRLKSEPRLRRIVELAGRYRLVAQAKQRSKPCHGYDDMVGPALGGDVGRLLSSEMASLAVPGLDDEVMLRLVHAKARVRDLRSLEGEGKGPLIVAIDESGSMESGGKVYQAKALALAMMWIARHQNRWFALVAYSGDSGERILAVPPGRWDEGAIAEWLVRFIGGGSSIDVPVREMPRMYADLGAPKGKTDVVFVTDAQCQLPPQTVRAFLDWKTSVEAKLTTLVIGSKAGDLSVVSDEVHLLDSLAVTEEAVGKVLSL